MSRSRSRRWARWPHDLVDRGQACPRTGGSGSALPARRPRSPQEARRTGRRTPSRAQHADPAGSAHGRRAVRRRRPAGRRGSREGRGFATSGPGGSCAGRRDKEGRTERGSGRRIAVAPRESRRRSSMSCWTKQRHRTSERSPRRSARAFSSTRSSFRWSAANCRLRIFASAPGAA